MNNLHGKKAILYRRVSTTDQKIHGNSLKAQQNSLRIFCKQNGILVKREFEEDYSAKDFDRPVMKELLDYAKKNAQSIDYLLLTSWDRFSRNVLEGQLVINQLSSIGIEVNSIENWIDYEDHNQLILHLIHLAMPEVDNRVRSQKVKMGMRQGLKEGRWNCSQPIGYIPGRDEFNKPLMQPCSIKAPLIASLFEDFAAGDFSQNQLLKLEKHKPLNLSKAT